MAVMSLAMVSVDAVAQETLTSQIHYRQNQYNFDPTYMNNAEAMRLLYIGMERIGIENIDYAEVICYASPEGNSAHNKELSQKRAIDSKWLIIKKYPEFHGRVICKGEGENWKDLRDLVAADKVMSQSTISNILAVIDAPFDSEVKQSYMKSRLGYDQAVGNVYQYLLDTYYPLVRNSCVLMFHLKGEKKVEPQPEVVPQPVVVAPVGVRDTLVIIDTVYVYVKPEPKKEEPVVEPVVVQEPAPTVKGKETFFALKTNLLYDLATMANVEVEIPFAKRWSLLVEDVFPWWEFQKNKYALQNWEMGPELRFWFKKWPSYDRKLKGWFVGAYGMTGKYDLQYDYDLCWQGTYWSSGLTIGYSAALGKKNWGNLEFSLSGGYLKASYQHYQPSGTYDVLFIDRPHAGHVTWIGPTKAKITLSIPIKFTTKRASRAAEQQGGNNE